VARQRQRARDRKGRGGDQDKPHPTETHRENIPGALGHASGDVDEFEAGIVVGGEGIAGGEGIPGDDVDPADAFGDDDHDVTDELGVGAGDLAAPDHQTSGAPTRGGGNRVFNFLRASWAELQRVQWPDRRQVFQATGVVAGFCIVAGLYLGLADYVAQQVVNFVLK